MKLKKILEELASSDKPQKLSKDQIKMTLESIGQFNTHGKKLKREVSLPEIVKSIKEVVDNASRLALEQINEDEWFDKKTVERNMNEVKKYLSEFEKIANENHRREMQLEALYDEIGHKLSRYYEIKDLEEVLPDTSEKK